MVVKMQISYKVPSKRCSRAKRQAFWSKTIADQNASGMSMKKFCRLHQLQYTTFKGYRYSANNTQTIFDHSKINCNNNQKDAHDSGIPELIPMQVAAETSAKECLENKIEVNGDKAEVKLQFNNGHTLKLSLSLSKENLSLLINTVAGLRC
jgi:hypothetical protein